MEEEEERSDDDDDRDVYEREEKEGGRVEEEEERSDDDDDRDVYKRGRKRKRAASGGGGWFRVILGYFEHCLGFNDTKLTTKRPPKK